MKISKILLTGAFVGMSLVSCTNEENIPGGSADSGTMSLGVETLTPEPKNSSMETRAVVETKEFPVTIYSKADNSQYASYANLLLVPNKLVMPVGLYYATAHTPGDFEKVMDSPYYSGSEDFEIERLLNTNVTVTCRMANGSFTVRFSDDFTTVFSTWSITIDDGTNTVIAYTNEDGMTPATKYMRFEENVKELTVNFVGNTIAGSRISATNTLTKKNASEQYDGDSEYFSGGDAIVLNFAPVENAEGDITGINLTANISFEETEEDFDMEVEDADPTGGDTPGEGDGDTPGEGDGDTPGGDTGDITLTLPDDMEITMSTDPSLGNAYIASENGIKSIKVKISSTSSSLMSVFAEMPDTYPSLDFVNSGTEVVGNEELVTMLAEVGQTIAVPAEGDKEYNFPIGNFFLFLGMETGAHTFDMVVTDMTGNTKSDKVVLTVK